MALLLLSSMKKAAQGWGLLEAARALRPHGPEYQLVVNFATARSFSCFTDEKNEALSS